MSLQIFDLNSNSNLNSNFKNRDWFLATGKQLLTS